MIKSMRCPLTLIENLLINTPYSKLSHCCDSFKFYWLWIWFELNMLWANGSCKAVKLLTFECWMEMKHLLTIKAWHFVILTSSLCAQQTERETDGQVDLLTPMKILIPIIIKDSVHKIRLCVSSVLLNRVWVKAWKYNVNIQDLSAIFTEKFNLLAKSSLISLTDHSSSNHT